MTAKDNAETTRVSAEAVYAQAMAPEDQEYDAAAELDIFKRWLRRHSGSAQRDETRRSGADVGGLPARVRALAGALTADGYAAGAGPAPSIRPAGSGQIAAPDGRGSLSHEGFAAPMQVELRVHDDVALDEIELYTDVLAAVAASDGPLPQSELDAALGLRAGIAQDPL
jgi:hypothetical protein